MDGFDFDLKSYVKEHKEDLEREVEVAPGAFVTLAFIPAARWERMFNKLANMRGGEAVRAAAAKAMRRRVYAEAVRSWRGMTPEALSLLMPVDCSGLPEELPYSQKLVEDLLEASALFENLVREETDKLSAFRQVQQEEQEKN